VFLHVLSILPEDDPRGSIYVALISTKLNCVEGYILYSWHTATQRDVHSKDITKGWACKETGNLRPREIA
jgi:hypothetical protein